MFEQFKGQVLILPYAVNYTEQELKVVSHEVEIAAVYCLAQCRRRKTRIISGGAEELEAISKVYYPLIAIPEEGSYAIIDGLGYSCLTMKSRIVPDTSYFIESLKKSATRLDQFIESLDMGAKLFSEFLRADRVERRIKYLIWDADLISLFSSFLERLEQPKQTEKIISFIPPRVSVTEGREIGKLISKERRNLITETSMLNYTLRVLGDEINHHMRRLQKESDEILRDYKRRLDEVENNVEKRIKDLNKSMEGEIKKVMNLYERRIRSILREKKKIDSEIHRIECLLEGGLRLKSKVRGRREPVLGDKTRLYEEKIESLRRDSHNFLKILEEIRKERDRDVRAIEEKYKALTMREREKLEVLRESRDAELSKVNNLIEKIKSIFLEIERQIKQLMEERNLLIRIIESCLLTMKINDPVIIGMPLYAIKYRDRNKVRIDFYPPAKITRPIETYEKARKNISRLNLESRIALFLSPLSDAIKRSILTPLIRDVDESQFMREKFESLIKAGNILEAIEFRDVLSAGLKSLEHEGWINERERNAILNSL